MTNKEKYELLLTLTAKELLLDAYVIGRNSKNKKVYDYISVARAAEISNFLGYSEKIEESVIDTICNTLKHHDRLKSI